MGKRGSIMRNRDRKKMKKDEQYLRSRMNMTRDET